MKDEPTGFALPFRIDAASGGIARAVGADKLRANLIHVLLCALGERPMRRDYGSGLRQLVHDPNNDALKAIVQHQLLKAVARWERRVNLRELRITQKEDILWIQVDYEVLSTRESGSVSLPFGMANE
jgi:hypothetical protein